MNSPIDLVGHRTGRLLVVEKVTMTPSGALWRCQCDCGGLVEKLTTRLRNKGTKHLAGCPACERERRSINSSLRTHGACTLGKPRLYRIWKSMRARCNNSSEAQVTWRYYAGRGIRVCAEWDAYPVFEAWALANGYAEHLTIDRKDNDGNYTPGNCRWATPKEQSANRRCSVH